MNFDGHQLVKLGTGWVLDMTEFICYKIEVDKDTGRIISQSKAFIVVINGKDYIFTRFIQIPVGVMRKAIKVIDKYIEELTSKQ